MSTPLSNSMTAMTPQQYADEWERSSSDHKRFFHYKWISSQLIEPKLVLEIGCGAGYGTEELLASGAKVVSIEINIDLLNKAADYLESKGYTIGKVPLSQIDNINLDTDIQCYIIEADIFDKNLDALFQRATFDYVLFSFFGAAPEHAAKGLNTSTEQLDNKFAFNYREKGTVRAFEIKNLCGEQCKLAIVDRIHQDQGYKAEDIRNFYVTDLAKRLDISEDLVTIRTRKNETLQITSTSKLNYINDGSFQRRLGTPLIAISII